MAWDFQGCLGGLLSYRVAWRSNWGSLSCSGGLASGSISDRAISVSRKDSWVDWASRAVWVPSVSEPVGILQARPMVITNKVRRMRLKRGWRWIEGLSFGLDFIFCFVQLDVILKSIPASPWVGLQDWDF